jgi:hypothetical protein
VFLGKQNKEKSKWTKRKHNQYGPSGQKKNDNKINTQMGKEKMT